MINSIKLNNKIIDLHSNPKQFQFINAIFNDDLTFKRQYEEFAFFGSFRCSKSFTCQLAVYLLCLTYPNLKAIYVRSTYDQLRSSVIKQFLDEFQEFNTFKYLEASRIAKFHNGTELRFRSYEYDTDILSTEADVIAACQVEDLPEELFNQLLGRASGRVLGPKGILITEGNPSSSYVKARYKDATPEELATRKIFFIEAKTADNPFITKEYIKSLEVNYPKEWLNKYLYGNWDSKSELVFSEFDPNIHIIDPIDPSQISKQALRRNGFDYGWVNPCANLWGHVDYDGKLIIYDEWVHNKTLPEDIVRVCSSHAPKILDNALKEVTKPILTVADHAMKGLKLPSKTDENKTVWTELERYGMLLEPCNKETLSNITLTNAAFKQSKLYITRNCAITIKQIKNWKWKEIKLGSNKNLSEEPVNKDDHTCDALLYLIGSGLLDIHIPTPEEITFKGSFAAYAQKINNKLRDKAYYDHMS